MKQYPHPFPVRLRDEDREHLADLARHANVSKGEILKRLLRSATVEQVAKAKYEGGPKVSNATGTAL